MKDTVVATTSLVSGPDSRWGRRLMLWRFANHLNVSFVWTFVSTLVSFCNGGEAPASQSFML